MTRSVGVLLLRTLCVVGSPAGADGAEAPYFLIAHDHRCAEASELQSWRDPERRSLEECYEECLASSECAYFAYWPSTGELGTTMDDCRIYKGPCLPFSSLLEGYHSSIYQIGEDPRSHVHSAVGMLMGRREGTSTVEHSHLLVVLSIVLSLSSLLATVVLSQGADEAARGSRPPVAALLAPGLPGRLLYADAERNEGGHAWRESARQFFESFGPSGDLLAEEAERLVDAHARIQERGSDDAPDAAAASERVLVIVEVLPELAGQFMDEAWAPRGG